MLDFERVWCKKKGIDYASYRAWRAMRARCSQPTHQAYKDYGGRGISYCARWNRFASFITDMGPCPGKGWWLDRIDNDGDYEPGNCRWATPATQAHNRRSTKLTYTVVREIRLRATEPQAKLAKEFGVAQQTISKIIRNQQWIGV
jgi:hypothetical protein